ncbi:glycoside hydrolase superfamily [Cunninghamella echinulata]|nr:glycoside hydrolase superfamily [Cunninghamella echinulata]
MIFDIKRLVGITAAALLLISNGVEAGLPDKFVAEYWGQNSAGAAGAGSQKNLAAYCDDNTDVFLLSFLTSFNVGGLPSLNLANACETTFEGTTLLECPNIAKDIKTCQAKGKKIILSLGGAAGSYGFTSDAQAETFAQTLWDMFGGGSHKYRPFGDAVLNGFDLDIEGGGSTGYAALVTKLKSLAGNKEMLITAAPQCPFPDAMMGDALNKAHFDAVFVQFYNNYCSPSGNNFNFDTWDNWASTVSKNKDVKVLLGLPGSPTAAGSGYIGFDKIKSTVESIQKYKSFGGVMFWDASQTYSNGNLASDIGKLIHSGSSTPPPTTTTPTKPTTVSTKPTSTSSSSPSSTPTNPGDNTCIKEGDACTSANKHACAGSSFAICDNGKWVVQPCSTGTVCFATTDGSSIYCAQSDGTPKDTCSTKSSNLAPKPYKNNKAQAQLSVIKNENEEWSALINARRTDIKPFGSQVVVSFTLPKNMRVNRAQNGKVVQKGNKVTIQVKNPHKKSMDLVFAIDGTIEKDSIFVAPSAGSMSFKS